MGLGFWRAWTLWPLDFDDQERVSLGRSFSCTGGTQGCSVSIQGLTPAHSWIPESLGDLLWGTGSIGAGRSSGRSGLLPASEHLPPPVTLPSLSLPQYICSYAHNIAFLLISNSVFSLSVGKADEEFCVSVIDALLTCAWQWKLPFTSASKKQQVFFSKV